MTAVFHLNQFALDGISRIAVLTAGIWRKMGWNVVFLVSQPPAELHFPLPSDVELIVLPWNAKKSGEDAGARQQWVGQVIEILRTRRADLWCEHAHFQLTVDNYPYHQVVSEIRRKLKLPCLLHLHNSFVTKCRSRKAALRFQKFVRDGGLSKNFEVVVAESRFDAACFQRFGAPAVYVPNIVDPDFGAVGDGDHDVKTILFLARFAPVKRPMEALRVFEMVHRRDPETRLIVVGSGEKGIQQEMRRYIQSRGLHSCVSMEGAQTKIVDYYSRAGVLLVTSEYEGFLMTALESMVCGLPVVMYELPYLEVCRQAGAVVQVPQLDRTAAAQAVLDIIGKREVWLRHSRCAKEAARRFAGFDHVSCYRRLLERVMNHERSYEEVDSETSGIVMSVLAHKLLEVRSELPDGRIGRFLQRMMKVFCHG